MKILHLLSQTELTGAEVYAITLANLQRAGGNSVIIASDKIHIPFDLPYIPLPVSKRSWMQRKKNVSDLKDIIRKQKIDIVHAHSRASSWVAHWATKGTKTGFVSTVHGRQHLHLSTKLYSVYGDRVIAVCENIRSHLIHEVGIPYKRIKVIPNGFEHFPDSKAEENFIFLAGRTTGPKGEITSRFLVEILPEILRKFPSISFRMAGGRITNLSAEARERIESLQNEFGTRMQVREFIDKNELNTSIERSKLVIASGRIALEALGSGKPLIAVGESHCHGLITDKNYPEAEASNFGDISEKQDSIVDLKLLKDDLELFLTDPKPVDLRRIIRERFDLGAIEKQVSAVYFQSLLEKRVPRGIPILMYHKVVGENFSSRHKTYISEKNFEFHLEFIRKKGFTPVGFQELYSAAIGNHPLPEKPVLLTFDDGYRSMITRALPILQKFKMKAVFFVLADSRIKENFWDPGEPEPELMEDSEIQQLVANGMELGAHSLSHRDFTKLDFQSCYEEVRDSVQSLESRFRTKIYAFAYPFGFVNENAKTAVLKAGMPFGVSTDSGGIHLCDDPMEVFRVNMFPQDGKWQILKKTSKWYRNYYFWKRGK